MYYIIYNLLSWEAVNTLSKNFHVVENSVVILHTNSYYAQSTTTN